MSQSTVLPLTPPAHSAGPVREPEPASKRQRVLEAAADLFMANGYGAVSMDAIAQSAGVSKATLYAWFASKDRLFATIVGEACLATTVAEDIFPLEPNDIGAALRVIAERVLRFLLQPRTLAVSRIVMAEAARFPELGQAYFENGPQHFRGRLAAWFLVQTASGRLAIPDPALAADQFSALLRTTMFMRATLALKPPASEADIEATVTATVDTFLRAFGPRATEA